MSGSRKTVISDGRWYRSGRHAGIVSLILLLVCGGSVGCLVPPICFPKTSVKGFVVDQYGKGVPDVQIETRQYPPLLIVDWTAPITKYIKTDQEGRWKFSAHKVGRLYIEAIPPEGYIPYAEPNTRPATTAGPFHDGDCPTNDIMLRLIKVRERGKDDKK